MSQDQFKAAIIDCIINLMGYDNCDISLATNMEKDLKMDIIDKLELVCYLEDMCEIEEIPQTAYSKLETLNDVYVYFISHSSIAREVAYV